MGPALSRRTDCPEVSGDQTQTVWANLAQYFIIWQLSTFSSSVECLGARIGCDIWKRTFHPAPSTIASIPKGFHFGEHSRLGTAVRSVNGGVVSLTPHYPPSPRGLSYQLCLPTYPVAPSCPSGLLHPSAATSHIPLFLPLFHLIIFSGIIRVRSPDRLVAQGILPGSAWPRLASPSSLGASLRHPVLGPYLFPRELGPSPLEHPVKLGAAPARTLHSRAPTAPSPILPSSPHLLLPEPEFGGGRVPGSSCWSPALPTSGSPGGRASATAAPAPLSRGRPVHRHSMRKRSP